jgi:hypothetical protein
LRKSLLHMRMTCCYTSSWSASTCKWGLGIKYSKQ